MKNTLKNLLKKYQTAAEAEARADAMLLADPENEALEAAWNAAYKVESAAFTELSIALANFTGGHLSPKDTRRLLLTKFDKVAELIEALA